MNAHTVDLEYVIAAYTLTPLPSLGRLHHPIYSSSYTSVGPLGGATVKDKSRTYLDLLTSSSPGASFTWSCPPHAFTFLSPLCSFCPHPFFL